MWTPAFDRFVAPARAKPQLWRLLMGIVIAALIYMAVFALVVGAAVASVDMGPLAVAMNELLVAETPRAVLILLATFSGMMLGPMAAARVMHGRTGRTLFGPGTGRGFAAGLGVTLALFVALLALLPQPFDPVPNTPLSTWLLLLAPALMGLAVQTGAEEVVFRGYLQSQLAARFDHPAIWMLLPSLLFGLAHYDPASQGDNALWIVAATGLFGLVAADLTRVTGSIGAAWGYHFANNAVALLLLGIDGPLSGLALYVTPFDASNTDTLRPLIVQDMIVTVIAWALLRLWFARRKR